MSTCLWPVFNADIRMSYHSFLESCHELKEAKGHIYTNEFLIGVKYAAVLIYIFLSHGLLPLRSPPPHLGSRGLMRQAQPDPHISRFLHYSSADHMSSRLRHCSRRPIIPLCNTQENVALAHVREEKQTPISNLSAVRKGCPAHLHPPSPPPPIYPFSPFSSAHLSALRNLIIAGPHSCDLSLGMRLKTNRSGLQQGAQEGREGQGTEAGL